MSMSNDSINLAVYGIMMMLKFTCLDKVKMMHLENKNESIA